MVIINPGTPIRPAALARPIGPAAVLPSGRVLHATVLEQRGQHRYELAAGQLRLMAESQSPLRKGENLQLQVIGQDSQQRPRLHIRQREHLDLAPLLRDRLPRQQSLTRLMHSLGAIQASPASTQQHMLSPLLAGIVHHRDLNGARALKQALANSGQFLEGQLLKGLYSPKDLKAQLLVLAHKLAKQVAPPPRSPLSSHYRPAAETPSKLGPLPPVGGVPAPASPYSSDPPPNNAQGLPGQLWPQTRLSTKLASAQSGSGEPSLLNEVKGALARLDVLQLLQRQGQAEGRCLLELPVMDSDGIDVWQLLFCHAPPHEVDKNPQRGDADQKDRPLARPCWRVNLCFDLPGLGPINAALSDHHGQLDIAFTVAKPDTLSRLERGCEELRGRLEQRQVRVAKIHCQSGEVAEQWPQSPLAELLQERA